jgi:molybdopterin synthase sulfur carrier subunit
LRDELIALGAPYAQALDRQRPVRAALNQVMSEEDQPLSEGCELAFFPPVTGG